MNKTYYREYYKLERTHWWFLVRLRILKILLEKHVQKRPMKILNVGVATGATSEMLREFGQVVSVEYDKECCDFINAHTDLNVLNGSVLNLDFHDRSFDLVCCFDVIEHVDDDKRAVRELHRVCRANGFIFVTVPAFQFLWSRHDEVNHHFRRYTKKSFGKLISPLNFTSLYETYFNSFLFLPIAIFRLMSEQFRKKKDVVAGSGSDFSRITSKYMNYTLYKIFDLESFLIRLGIKFPVGVSLLMLVKKEEIN